MADRFERDNVYLANLNSMITGEPLPEGTPDLSSSLQGATVTDNPDGTRTINFSDGNKANMTAASMAGLARGAGATVGIGPGFNPVVEGASNAVAAGTEAAVNSPEQGFGVFQDFASAAGEGFVKPFTSARDADYDPVAVLQDAGIGPRAATAITGLAETAGGIVGGAPGAGRAQLPVYTAINRIAKRMIPEVPGAMGRAQTVGTHLDPAAHRIAQVGRDVIASQKGRVTQNIINREAQEAAIMAMPWANDVPALQLSQALDTWQNANKLALGVNPSANINMTREYWDVVQSDLMRKGFSPEQVDDISMAIHNMFVRREQAVAVYNNVGRQLEGTLRQGEAAIARGRTLATNRAVDVSDDTIRREWEAILGLDSDE